ncbi:zinc transporter ZIP9 isoform X2 [Drosophila albomicans]|uniref:Zinc transporter ZIP9 isoform X2 n=1 Tax=Drosophila albomicans TaxID=7291 RepID=A0A6P8XHQ3_DROAB|nr:zinc transporter ZIP9 isoform X2 [Drosophila albomicans]
MTEETIILMLLVIVMLVGSYLAGSIPLVMHLSEEKLKCVTVLGAGLLVGTALTVIIPEGIRSLYMDSKRAVAHNDADTTIVTESHVQPLDYSRTIGLSLVLGFVFMMLVDQVSQGQTKKSNNGNEYDKNITATLGLVVHAAADGVALGAAATTSHQDVEIIVFLAIMLHKAPAAFGLVSFLLHAKVERQQIRKHLGIFSLSAPLLTLLTYFGIGQEQKETLNSVNATGIAMLFSAGTFLYVATVHVLPELTHREQSSHSPSNLYDYHLLEESREAAASNEMNVNNATQSQSHHHNKGLRFGELIVMICGALLPLIITFSHQH